MGGEILLPRHTNTEVKAWLAEAYRDPRSSFPPMIATPGYTLPDLEPLQWFEAAAGVSAGGVNVHHWGSGSTNNWIVVPAAMSVAGSLAVVFIGNASGNVVVIGRNANLHGQIFFHGNGGLALFGGDLGQRSEITARLWSEDNLLFWGKKCTSNSVNITIEGDGKSVVLGDDCMLAREVSIRTSDEHALVDLDGGEYLNPPASVHVEPRVWLCDRCTILKGVHLGYGSVVGNASVVTRSLPRFSIAAGVPARILRTGISWSRFHRPEPGLAEVVRAGEARLVGPAPLTSRRNSGSPDGPPEYNLYVAGRIEDQVSHPPVAPAGFLLAFKRADAVQRSEQVAAELAANRDNFGSIVTVAAARSTDCASFVRGVQIALDRDPANLPALRLLAWHQIREADWEAARQTLRSVVEHWPEIPDVRRELARVGMMSPGNLAAAEALEFAAKEFQNRLAVLSYRCQIYLAAAEAIPESVRDELKLNVGHACAEVLRDGASADGVAPDESATVFLEIVKSIIAAPTVALIGNGPSLKDSGLGAEIDAHGIVIRCNFPVLSGFERHVGSKADIVFFNESLVDALPRLLTQSAAYEQCLSLAFHPEPAAIFPAEVYRENMNGRISRIPLRLREFYRSFFYNRPTTGMMGIILITALLGKNLTIYGFDFYDKATPHYFPSQSPVFLGHELHYERWFLERFLTWLDMGKVAVGSPMAQQASA